MILMVNGVQYKIEEPAADRSLLDALRDDLGLTGTKKGCDAGDCGACTVLLNGVSVNACLVLAAQAEGVEVLTIEGVAVDGQLHPLQEAFIRHGAVQCGYCTPGMVLSALAWLGETPHPDRAKIQEAIAGNLCRCTGYVQIIDAIEAVARTRP